MSKTLYQVGDRVEVIPTTFGVETKRKVKYPGTVTYVNEAKRWYQVTFDNGVKECYHFPV